MPKGKFWRSKFYVSHFLVVQEYISKGLLVAKAKRAKLSESEMD